MTPSETERQALLFHLSVGAKPNALDAPIHTMDDVIRKISEMWQSGDAVYKVKKGTTVSEDGDDGVEDGEEDYNIIVISHVETMADGNTVVLFNFGDSEGTAPAFLHKDTLATRIVERGEDEGNGYSAHLVIGPSETGARVGLHRCALERMPHLGRGTLVQFMNRLLRAHAKDVEPLTCPDPDTRRPKKYWPILMSSLQMSPKLKDDIKKGRLTHIDFTTRHDLDQADENLQIEVQKKYLRVRVTSSTGDENRAIRMINNIKEWGAQQGYEEMQLHIRSEEGNVSPRLATDLDDAKDAVYSRLEQLTDFENPLKQCYPNVDQGLRDKLTEIVCGRNFWT